MEERIIDDPRKIKVKRNPVGGVEDATDALAPETEQPASETEDDELYLELPENGELDEDLIGLAPSQLEKELERRRKAAEEAAAERDRLLGEAETAFAVGNFADAEPLYEQALAIDPACTEASKGMWRCRTADLTSIERLTDPDIAREFSESDHDSKALVLGALGEKLKKEREELKTEAAPLRERVFSAQKERRGAFLDNRNYYRARLCVFIALFVLLGIAAAVSAQFIVRVVGIIPAIVTIVLGALAVLDLIPIIIFARKFVVAQRLCSENEKLSSTEDGAVLAEIEEKLSALALILNDN